LGPLGILGFFFIYWGFIFHFGRKRFFWDSSFFFKPKFSIFTNRVFLKALIYGELKGQGKVYLGRVIQLGKGLFPGLYWLLNFQNLVQLPGRIIRRGKHFLLETWDSHLDWTNFSF